MKKTILKSALLAVAGVGLMAGTALATPVFNGNPYAEMTGDSTSSYGNPELPTSSGYYVWANNNERTSWSVRWTGNNNASTSGNVPGETQIEDWRGSVDFLGVTGDSLAAVNWDNHDGGDPDYTFNWNTLGISFQNAIYDPYDTAASTAGWHWDGFDFTIEDQQEVGRIRFNLGGSLYSGLTLDNSQTGVAAQNMWVGNGLIPNVNVQTAFVNPNEGAYTYQSFEVPAPVPEPATMFLFGTGLAGLAGYRRKKNKKA